MGLFPKFKSELGSSFSSQRQGGHLATTQTHVLANNCHGKKVYVSKFQCQDQPMGLTVRFINFPPPAHRNCSFRKVRMSSRMGLIHFFFQSTMQLWFWELQEHRHRGIANYRLDHYLRFLTRAIIRAIVPFHAGSPEHYRRGHVLDNNRHMHTHAKIRRAVSITNQQS
jgi:hypothetical protein